MPYSFVAKNIGNYRKYDIFFNFRFTGNMIFPSIAEVSRKYDIYVKLLNENVVFHAVVMFFPYIVFFNIFINII